MIPPLPPKNPTAVRSYPMPRAPYLPARNDAQIVPDAAMAKAAAVIQKRMPHILRFDPTINTSGIYPNGKDIYQSQPPPLAETPPTDLPRISKRAAAFVQPSYQNDEMLLGDGYDSSRDITGVEAAEGPPDKPYVLRMTMANLKPGAEQGHLDAYFLIGTGQEGGSKNLPDGIAGDTAHPWNLAVKAYDNEHSQVINPGGALQQGALSWVKFDPVVRVIEVALDKQTLRGAGWKDGQPLQLQAFTSCDYSGKITDSLDAPKDKPWMNGGHLRAAVSTDATPTPLGARSWEGESIYFVFTDRFNDGDPNNNQGVDKNDLRRYHGGDLRGVIDKLDYIKNLGMSTLWISPPMAAQKGHYDPDGSYYEGFHGYWPVDLYKVEPKVGDMPTLKELVNKAHEKGMKVLLDLPLNQTAWEHPWTKDPSKNDWYHHNGNITNWDDPNQLENYSVLGLPDLAQENPKVEHELMNVAKFWIDQTGIDGFRLDAVKHVPHSFWEKFSREMHSYAGPDFLLLGEDLHGDPGHVASYQAGGLTGMLDFPLYFTMRDTIGRGAPMTYLADRISEENHRFDNSRMLSVFLDNHDLNRFITDAGDNGRDKLKLALALAFTLDRIPNVYQGTEVGMAGAQEGDDPQHRPLNRKDMEFDKDPDLQAYFTKLGQLRQSTPALRSGGYLETWKDDSVLAYERCSRQGSALTVLNASGNPQHRDIPIHPSGGLHEGDRLRDALSGREYSIRDGKLSMDLAARTPAVLLPVSTKKP